MALTVLSIAFPLAPVRPDAVGGAEQVVSMIDEALVAAGHRSIVIACAGSQCAGELVPLPAADEVIEEAVWRRQHQACRSALQAVLQREQVDVVHAHGVDFADYVGGVAAPLVATLHLPPSWYRPRPLVGRPPAVLVFVSEAQRASAGDIRCPSVVVRNGVRLDRFRFEPRKGRSVVALGRISPEKGFHFALDACRVAGVPLTLAGSLFRHPEHLAYFEHEIVPRLDAERRFVGPVDLAGRRDLLAQARCLLITSTAPETSSLVAMESMASGTPVVAMRVGALPEIVEDGHTGVLVDGIHDIPAAIARAAEVLPSTCRRVAESRFSASDMCDRYLSLYAEVARQRAGTGRTIAEHGQIIVDSPVHLRDLEADWRSIWSEQPDALPFAHPAWVLPAIEVFAPDELVCIVSRRNRVLGGILPLGITRGELTTSGALCRTTSMRSSVRELPRRSHTPSRRRSCGRANGTMRRSPTCRTIRSCCSLRGSTAAASASWRATPVRSSTWRHRFQCRRVGRESSNTCAAGLRATACTSVGCRTKRKHIARSTISCASTRNAGEPMGAGACCRSRAFSASIISRSAPCTGRASPACTVCRLATAASPCSTASPAIVVSASICPASIRKRVRSRRAPCSSGTPSTTHAPSASATSIS